MRQLRTIIGLAALLVAVLCVIPVAQAQEGALEEPAAPVQESEPADAQQLHILEQALLRDYERFEEKLLELAEYTRGNDPARADLLLRARSESTSRRVQAQMERIAEALAPTESGDVLYGDALSRQEELLADLAELLKLLQSEDERDRIDREIARLMGLIKDANRLIGDQKDVRADTERGGESSKLAGDQQDVTDLAEQLAEKIAQQDAERQAEADRNSSPSGSPQQGNQEGQSPGEQDPLQPGDSPKSAEPGEPSSPEDKPEGSEDPSEREPGDPQESESSPQDKPPAKGTPQDGEPSKGGKPSQSESQEPSQGSPQESQGGEQQSPPQQGQNPPQQGEPGEQQGQQPSQQSPSQQTPGREQLEEARERMERAIEELEQKRLDKASDEQDAALAKLEEMKAQLEEILRQLREEEHKLFLMALEARFQQMLQQQLDINNGTLKLARIPEQERDQDRHLGEATKLSRDEAENVSAAEKALLLLREEGSSVAFPEAVEMMRDNMQAVVGRLQRGETGETTQLLERMIVESLEEMVFALQREIEKQDEKKQEQGQPQQGQPTDPQLVDKLAELKMIRSLQSQVNRLTRQYGLEFDGEQATDPGDLEFLRNLALRQERIRSATYDLSIGKNR